MRNSIPLLIVVLLTAACQKEKENLCPPQPQWQKIEMHVHAAGNYTSKYNNVTAEVKLVINKINNETGAVQPVWDSTITNRALTQYPVLPQKFVMEQYIPVFEQKEKLQATYFIYYKAKEENGSRTATEESKHGETFTFLDVAI